MIRIGEEAFRPRNETDQIGLFTLLQLSAGSVRVEAGLRYELTDQAARPGPDASQFFAGKRDFRTLQDLAPLAGRDVRATVRVGF